MKELKISFTNKEITPWGGIVLLKKMLNHISIEEILSKLPLPKQGANRGYSPIQLIETSLVSVRSGANKFEH